MDCEQKPPQWMEMANGSPSAAVGGWVEVQTHCNHLDSLSSSDLTHIPSPHSPCNRCHHPNENWLCLGCKVVLCSRYVNKHMLEHYQQTNHCLSLGYRDLSVWCYICHAFLDAQVILPLRPIYETAYALKFGRALIPQTAEYLHQEATVDCNESEFDTEDSADDVSNADVAPTKNPPSNGSVAALWEGHSVNESYVDLLSLIKKAHPETFELCSFKTPSLYTSALNMLGEFYTLFASSRVDEMTVNDIGRFRDMFSDLELLRFNVGWLRERLDRIEELRVTGGLLREYEELLDRVKVKERELAEVKILCAAKEMVLRAMFSFLGEKDSTRCAADGLLPSGCPEGRDPK